MAEEQIPEAWTAREVAIHFVDHRELLAILIDVREFGFVYEMLDSEMQIFTPWSAILWMRPPGEDAEIMRRDELGELD
jgi:hypothetical protein